MTDGFTDLEEKIIAVLIKDRKNAAQVIADAGEIVGFLDAETSSLKETNSRLNRRCQEAESAASVKVEEVLRAGPSLGRSLACWAAADCSRKLEAAILENKELKAKFFEIAGVMQGSGLDREVFDTVYKIAKAVIEKR